MDPKFYGIIKDGHAKLDPESKKKFIKHARSFKEDTEIEITLTRKRKIRSYDQSKYYFAVVVKILSDYTGYTKKEMHAALKVEFLQVPGKVLPTLRSTADLSTQEFNDYCKTIQLWAASKLNVYIPDPNEVDYD